MDKTFDAAEAERRIYAKWEAEGRFRAGANASRDETFCIVIPPPNVTGSLHMGHALNNALQDILIRWKRMQGYDTLWQPGTDHAGIATQMVVERMLMETQQPGRREMGREAFVDKVWEWKHESGGTILNQLKRLGASCDWERDRFTMDEGLSAAVLKVFVQLYDEGLIYKGKRLVNWDPQFETAISDLEVENIEVDGHMWHFKYLLEGGATYEYVEKDEDGNVTLRETRDYISIATTRPETMLGDGAVAVHSSDERYAPIVGQLCEIPVGPKEHRRLIPIITDDYPDPDFGSGAVKITGAHDFNDYGVANRNDIPKYRLMDTKAHMRDDGAPYVECAALAQQIVDGASMSEAEIDAINLVPDDLRGLDRYDARKRVVEQITAEGLAVMVPANDPRISVGKEVPDQVRDNGESTDVPGEDPGPQIISFVEAKKIMAPYGDRSKVVIEPMLTDQWFVDAATLAKPAIKAVRQRLTEFAPKNWENTYYHWMENIEPWCISRQLWWGHQIPVWYGPAKAGGVGPKQFCGEDEQDVAAQAARYYGSKVEIRFQDRPAHRPDGQPAVRSHGMGSETVVTDEGREFLAGIVLKRDEDVLDTWFSSALWPFSTLGWPEKTPELDRYYKTDVLITGNDIIFFWVARMMMMGLKFMDEVPFDTVYINSIVVDAKGKKMSKSQGNIIDPLELIEKYGADALRFTLASQEVQGRRQLRLSEQAVDGGRRFGTKLWNAARFAEMNGCYEGGAPAAPPVDPTQTPNKWIVGETARTLRKVDAALEACKFNEAAGALYDHVWKVFCDWYVESSKPLLTGPDEAVRAETRATMAWALDQCLIMLHPIVPFITEELWGNLATREKPLIHADWPALDDTVADEAADREMDWVIRLIEEIRSARSAMNVPDGARIPMAITGPGDAVTGRLGRNEAMILRLAQLSDASVVDQAPDGAITLAMEDCAVNLPLAEVIDVAAEGTRLAKAVGKLEKEIGGLEGKLANEKFLSRAPAEVIEEQRERLAVAAAERERLAAAQARIEGLS
ncbi:MAG: valine--tRNA ligase [Paracoccaceae bacterium]|nr:valine--tRNA ligase [Paracoccaceae bacterium]